MSKKSSVSPLLLLAGVALAGLGTGVLVFSRKPLPAPAPAQSQPVDGILTQPAPQPSVIAAGAEQRTVSLYRVTNDDNGSHLTPVTSTIMASSPEDIAVSAINKMSQFGKDNPLPDGAKALSVNFDGDTATVDFNDAFQKNFQGGDENEAITLNSVMAILGQFPGVKQVQFLIEGKKIDSLGGTQTLNTPLPVPQTIDASPAPSTQTAQSTQPASDSDHGQ